MQTKTGAPLATGPEQNSKDAGRVLVLGLGNILLKDEGIGVHVAGRLQKQNLPGNVEVIDGGTASLDILLSQEGPYKLVAIDAMKAGKEPGTIYRTRLKADAIDRLAEIFSEKQQSRTSLHQVGLIDALLVAEKTNCAPEEITIIGVEPDQIDAGLELTEQLEQKIPEIINTVLEEIKDAVYTR
ncbi:MAG: HyaD/HybD family hydrogenase maturation endopeptidase [Planctomycetota bacterium]|jgi:hydrogenase maturation protease